MPPVSELTRPDLMVPRAHTVMTVRQETHDIVSIDVEPAGETIAFRPGQFDMVYVFGVGEAAISISSDTAHPEVLTHTIRAVGWVTQALNTMQPGSTIGIRGPFGTPWPVEDAQGGDLLIVAGGIGLAPVRPALLAALAARDRYDRVSLLVGARSPQDLVFRADLHRWEARDDLDVHVTVDSATRGWTGRVGVVTRMIPQIPFTPQRTTVFTCGPEVMMRYTAQALLDRGVPPERIHVTLERNMRCGLGFCGHCQLGGEFVCRDGPVFTYKRVSQLMEVREL